MFDLGRDIAPQKFLDKAIEVDADIIALSTLMTTTMANMDATVKLLKEKGLRERFKVIIGGGATGVGIAIDAASVPEPGVFGSNWAGISAA